jgi:hypothetical protein
MVKIIIYDNPHTRPKIIAKALTFIEVGSTASMPKSEVTKLAGRKSMEMYVSIWILRPWRTVVRASRTVEALKSCP